VIKSGVFPAWWFIPIIPALRKLQQEEQHGLIVNPVSKTKKKRERQTRQTERKEKKKE
jgi:hypothetical protein